MKRLQEILQTKGKFQKNLLLLSGICLVYAILYQLFANVLYQQENTLLLYLYTYVLCLLGGGILAFVIQKILDDQQENRIHGKAWFLSFFMIQTIFYIVMSVLGYASFSMAANTAAGFFAYALNAILVLVVLFYVPVVIFSFYEMAETHNPFAVIYASLKVILHRYQPVFYSCLIAAIVFIGYRYLMQTVFSFQMGVSLYDLPMEIMTRWVPFMDAVSLLTMLSENGALLLPLCFSFLFAVLQCVVLLTLLYYLGAVDHSERS